MLVKSYILVCLFFTSSIANGQERFINLKEGKCKPRSGPDESVTLDNVQGCVETCLANEDCASMQYSGSTCKIFYTKIKKIVDAEKGAYCGRVTNKEPSLISGDKCSDSIFFNFGSFDWQGKSITRDCAWIAANTKLVNTRRTEWCSVQLDGKLVSDKCPIACGICTPFNVCSNAPGFTFGSYEWDGVTTTRDCAWISENGMKKKKRQNRWCDDVFNGQKVSEACPEACDICDNSCDLKATLDYPFNSPDDASYYGHNSDYLEVTMEGDDYWECSWAYSDGLPDWCTYKNTDPNGDSASIVNLDDAYEELETLTGEEISITGASGNTYKFLVNHWFYNANYYPELDEWNDHMMPAVLKVKNMSNLDQGHLRSKGWTRPVEIDVPTHILQDGEWIKNPDYKAKFMVTVSCTSECFCSSSYEVMKTD